MTPPPPRDGILLLRKPAGPTSHDMVDAARRALGVRRIGHAGTLDPFATGLLVLLIGEATRLQDHFLHRDKVYEGEIRLGTETDSGDPTGKPVREVPPRDWPPFDLARLEEIISRDFIGKVQQVPPVFSALKVDGERAYALARSGREVALSPRTVTLHAFSVSLPSAGRILFRLHCESGTYVRSVAVDLGRALGIPAHLGTLDRTQIGDLKVDDASDPDSLASAPILKIEECLSLRGEVSLPKDHPTVAGLRMGRWQLLVERFSEDGLWGVRVDGELAQIYERKGGGMRLTYNQLKG